MKNNTYIILVSIKYGSDDRQILEEIENNTFENFQQATDFIENKELQNKFEIISISDFMQLCNDEEFYAANYWLGYINILE